MVEYSLDLQNINLSAIRTVRVLRPLKAINRVPSKSCFPLTPLSSACGEYLIYKGACGGVVPAGFRYKVNRGFCRVCAGFSPSQGQEALLDGQENRISQHICPGHPLYMAMLMELQELKVNSKRKCFFFLLLKDITGLMMSVASKRACV